MPSFNSSTFDTALRAFAEDLKRNFASGIPAQAEDQLKGPVQALLRAVKPNVETRSEAQVHDLGGRPDIGVSVQRALCGYVELKAPGVGARTSRFRGVTNSSGKDLRHFRTSCTRIQSNGCYIGQELHNQNNVRLSFALMI